jgi:hypothetical protein
MFNIEKSLPLLIIHVEMAIGQNSDQWKMQEVCWEMYKQFFLT